MKLATYNIWNDEKGIGNRVSQILEEIRACNADIIGLQEVEPAFCRDYIAEAGYPYWEFRKYSNDESVNLHLPWNSAKQKEIQTVAIDRYMHQQAGKPFQRFSGRLSDLCHVPPGAEMF